VRGQSCWIVAAAAGCRRAAVIEGLPGQTVEGPSQRPLTGEDQRSGGADEAKEGSGVIVAGSRVGEQHALHFCWVAVG
jgi:hypothetical protein